MPVFVRAGILTTILTFLGGIWLFFAPFIVGYQKVGQHWIDATRNDLWTGGALMAVSAVTFLLFCAFGLRDAARAARRRALERDREEKSQEATSATGGAPDAI